MVSAATPQPISTSHDLLASLYAAQNRVHVRKTWQPHYWACLPPNDTNGILAMRDPGLEFRMSSDIGHLDQMIAALTIDHQAAVLCWAQKRQALRSSTKRQTTSLNRSEVNAHGRGRRFLYFRCTTPLLCFCDDGRRNEIVQHLQQIFEPHSAPDLGVRTDDLDLGKLIMSKQNRQRSLSQRPGKRDIPCPSVYVVRLKYSCTESLNCLVRRLILFRWRMVGSCRCWFLVRYQGWRSRKQYQKPIKQISPTKTKISHNKLRTGQPAAQSVQ
mmetsp:Transcript_50007/g.109324  ORF Transcript_50007/g.109324 Transcript_50007/m.109324 type:complete len:271 (-) Transcript_50007:776-1588(-)